MPADAHAEFEARLKANGYTPQPERNILDECEFKDSRTGKFVKLTKKELQEIADARNRLIENKHAAAAISLGHTKDGVAEDEQPDVAGVATRWRLGKFKDGTHGIWITPWEDPAHKGKMKAHPGTSVELWLNPNDVNPIAFLKSTTPRRDLEYPLAGPRHFDRNEETSSGRSIVRFAREDAAGRQPILFAMKGESSESIPQASKHMDKNVKCDDPDMAVKTDSPTADTAPTDDAVIDKIANSDWGKALMASLNEIKAFVEKAAPVFEELEAEAAGQGGAGAPPGEPPAGGPDAGAPASPDAGAPPAAGGPPGAPPAGGPDGHEEPDGDEDDKDQGPAKRNSAGSAAGYGNTTMPNYAQYARGYGADAETAIRLQKLEQENLASKRREAEYQKKLEASNKETAALRLERMQDETNILLDQLAREGVTLDREYDFGNLVKLSKEKRNEEAERMRKLRAKAKPELPNGGKLAIDPEQVAAPQAVRFNREDQEGLDMAIQMGRDPSIQATEIPDDYDSLVKFVHGEKPTAPTGVKVR